MTSTRREIVEFLKLSLPLAAAQVAQAATGFVDTVMMGWMGDSELAAGGLAATTFTTILLSAGGIVTGVSPLIARSRGESKYRIIGKIARQGMIIALFLAVPLTVVLGRFDTILEFTGQSDTTIAIAGRYFEIIRWGLLPALMFWVLRGAVASVSQVRPIACIVLAATILNALGNYVLGFGHFGFPTLGIAGLALASTLAHWLMFFGLLIYIRLAPSCHPYGFFRQKNHLDADICLDLLKIGVPIGISAALEGGLIVTITYLAGMLGTAVLAAHQIVLQTIVLFFMVPLGMSQAATVRVGTWLGTGDGESLKRSGYISITIAGIFMTAAALLLLLYPDVTIGLYLNPDNPANRQVINIAVPMLTVAALGQILDGVQRVANGALQGLQDTRIPALCGFLCFWGIGLSAGYMFGFIFRLGGVGLWIGQSLGLGMAAIAFVYRFNRLVNGLKS